MEDIVSESNPEDVMDQLEAALAKLPPKTVSKQKTTAEQV